MLRMIQNYKNKDRGVALIFFVLVFGIMMAFLLMIINTGMLVYQKMRLQSSVDLAAYAGASVQASYMGNQGNADRQVNGSGEDSIQGLNNKILKRYGKLLKDLQFGTIAAAPGFGGMGLAANAAACVA